MIISSIISIFIIWSGDFSAQLQFDGPLKTEIKGELVEGNKTCEVYGRFDEVMLKEKNQLEKYIKANFRFVCTADKQSPQEIKLATEVIRATDLKPHSANVFISNQFKKNTFKIENYSIQISKKPSKTSGK